MTTVATDTPLGEAPPPPPEDRAGRVQSRYRVRRGLWRSSSIPRVQMCGRAVVDSGVAAVHRIDGPDGPRGAVTGLSSCGSVWACPVCSAHIRAERSADAEEGARRHQEAGGGLSLLTLTFSHSRHDSLADNLDALLAAWRRVVTGAPWKRLRQRWGVVGYIRTVEVTYGDANGWHPHLHVVLATEAPLSEVDTVTLEQQVFSRWVTMAEKCGLGTPQRGVGCKLVRVWRPEDAAYGFKVQESSLALEAFRGDLKRSTGDRWQAFDLADLAGQGIAQAVALWHEYEAATKGRRAHWWSKGLRERWGLDAERDDQEITEEDHTTPETQLVELTREDWRDVVAAGADHAIREAAAYGESRDEGRAAVLTVLTEAKVCARARLQLVRAPLYASWLADLPPT